MDMHPIPETINGLLGVALGTAVGLAYGLAVGW